MFALGQTWGVSSFPYLIPVRLWVPTLPSGQASAGFSKALACQVSVCVGSLGTPSSGILFTMGVALRTPIPYICRQAAQLTLPDYVRVLESFPTYFEWSVRFKQPPSYTMASQAPVS